MISQGRQSLFELITHYHLLLGQRPEEILGSASSKEDGDGCCMGCSQSRQYSEDTKHRTGRCSQKGKRI